MHGLRLDHNVDKFNRTVQRILSIITSCSPIQWPILLEGQTHFQNSCLGPMLLVLLVLMVKKVDNHGDLGVILSSSLSWEPHYQYVTSKAYKLLGLL